MPLADTGATMSVENGSRWLSWYKSGPDWSRNAPSDLLISILMQNDVKILKYFAGKPRERSLLGWETQLRVRERSPEPTSAGKEPGRLLDPLVLRPSAASGSSFPLSFPEMPHMCTCARARVCMTHKVSLMNLRPTLFFLSTNLFCPPPSLRLCNLPSLSRSLPPSSPPPSSPPPLSRSPAFRKT